jgi:APA family basic amino acid/polyamine antiporter
MMFGQSRLFYSISRDGLLPKKLSKVNAKTQVPTFSTWVTGGLVAVFAGLIPLNKLAELTNIGTLFAFSSVSLGILVLRKTRPDIKRGFKTPWVPVIPVLAVVFCVYLMLQLSAFTWEGFLVWLVIGLVVYFTYGYKHSRLNQSNNTETKVETKTNKHA